MTTDGGSDLVRRAAREWWPNLPVLLVGSIAVAAGWAVLRSVAGSGWISLLGIGLLVIPLLAVLLDGCLRLLDDQHVGVLELVRGLPGVVGRAWRVTGPVTLVAVLADAAAVTWQRGGQPWMLVSLAICTTVLLGLVFVAVFALPYALRAQVGAREAWLVGAFLATRHPVLAVGVLSACGVTVWAAAHLSFALLILLPAPLALIWAAAATEASVRGRVRLASGGRQVA